VTPFILIAIDLVAIAVLTFGLYFPRHRRRDLVVAFLIVNVGVLAVSEVLGSTAVSAGVGLGLFGVLSIIRLRSSEIAQHEVAYYFAALALGLFAGMSTTVEPLTVGLMALILLVILVGDHPGLFKRYRQQVIVLDRAFADETALIAHLEGLLGARVHGVKVERLDLVNDMTTVDVRYQLGAARTTAPTLESLVTHDARNA
jgi:Ca2+/Na+ antiporter